MCNKNEWVKYDSNSQPENGEEVLIWNNNKSLGDEYFLCTFYKKGSIIYDDYDMSDKKDSLDRIIQAVFNQDKRGAKVVQTDSFCFPEIDETTGLFKWRVMKKVTYWKRLVNPFGKANEPEEVEMFKEELK